MWKCCRSLNRNFQEFTIECGEKDETLKAPITIGEGRYEIKDIKSADGGFGIVYKAIDKKLNNRNVLIKARRYDNFPGLFSYAYDKSRDDEIRDMREEISFEIKCLKAFKNSGESRMPNINDVVYDYCPEIHGPHIDVDGVRFYCEDEEIYNNEPYIVMQMIDGENLGHYVNMGFNYVMNDRNYTNIRRWENDVMEYALELTTILSNFHKRHKSKIYPKYNKQYFIYQDLKPDNIIITSKLFITLLDFGSMNLVLENDDGEVISNIKGAGIPGAGTFGYKPPEFRSGSASLAKLDERADIYTLGATLYHLLRCKPLTEELKTEDTIIPIERLMEMGYLDETANIIKKCTEYRKEDRYKNVMEVRAAILKNMELIRRNML